ncbi:hypothetical protein C8A00DRAFT_35973 [Chaetomidium leptoderma]|uniref:Uncharacterized protein n=1 Tax=Chaetomidium leptoderma TaxID=669021 RepID=A0AAN6VH03_9PEZI|nr:hypothetical protein C8A00DRAFT_35973 [Chaetomidium leptoderma]
MHRVLKTLATCLAVAAPASDSVCAASPTSTQDDGGGTDEATKAVTSAESVSTAGAARMMPFRLW